MRVLAVAVLAVFVIHSSAWSKTDAEKVAERAARDSVAATKREAKEQAKIEREYRKKQEKAWGNSPAQVLIVGADLKKVQGLLVRNLSQDGWIPRDVGDYAATFEKSQGLVGSAIAGAIVGTPYGGNATAKHRITFTLFADAGGIRVVNSMVDLVVNEGMRTEYHGDQTKKSKGAIQPLLDQLKYDAEPTQIETKDSPIHLAPAPPGVAPTDSITPK